MKIEQMNGLGAFSATVQRMSFSGAAAQLHVSPSAVSQAISQLESQLGVRLFHRTTRQVQLTEAGKSFYDRIQPALNELLNACEEAHQSTSILKGSLRLHLPRTGFELLIEPRLRSFLEKYPDISLDIDTETRHPNLIAEGFDCGLTIGENIEKDMIGIKITSELQAAIVASPDYFKKNNRPRQISDLKNHCCINFRYHQNQAIYRWEFEDKGKEIEFIPQGNITFNDSKSMINAAINGLGIAYVLDIEIVDALEKSLLDRVLTKYSPVFPGFYFYYPSRKHIPTKLKAFVEYFKQKNI